jgi:hypothetical protein
MLEGKLFFSQPDSRSYHVLHRISECNFEVRNLQFQFFPVDAAVSVIYVWQVKRIYKKKKHHRLTDELLKPLFRLFQKCLQLAKSSFLEFRKSFMSSDLKSAHELYA